MVKSMDCCLYRSAVYVIQTNKHFLFITHRLQFILKYGGQGGDTGRINSALLSPTTAVPFSLRVKTWWHRLIAFAQRCSAIISISTNILSLKLAHTCTYSVYIYNTHKSISLDHFVIVIIVIVIVYHLSLSYEYSEVYCCRLLDSSQIKEKPILNPKIKNICTMWSMHEHY